MDRPHKLKTLLNSLTGRMVLGVLLVHALLAPVLFGGILYIVKQGYQAQFINQVRGESHLIAAVVGRDLDAPQLNSHIEDILLGEPLMFIQILASDGSVRYSSENPLLAKADFKEDFFFGQHDDAIYYIALPLYTNPGDSPATLHLGYDEEPTQEQIRTTYQRTIFLALIYILLTIALVTFSGIQITYSLRRLRDAARKVALGDRTLQLDIGTSISEVTSLGEDLERMRWQLVHQSELIEHQAFHDTLTGLPNRALLNDRIHQALTLAHRNHTSCALCVVDLDRFKEVNDTLGHHIGDLLLQKLALRMREALRDSDTIARLGGDEFAILMPTIEDAQHAALATKKLLKLLEIPLLLEGHTITIGASIGIALFPEHGNDKGTLMRRADMAMYSAKRTHSGYAIYHLSLDQQSPEERSLIEELHRACEHNKFVLYFKPQIAAHTGKVETIEALLHWQHPGRGLLMPSQFISTAEKCGLINPISLWVLQEAANQCRRWQQLGFDIPVNISLSDHYLQDPGMPHSILKVWENSGIDSACLELEISESAIVEDPVYLSSVIQRLHNMGVRIVIGAYGSAPSSLIYLHDLPIYRIKIDTSLISNVADNDSFALLQTTIKLAQDMGHTVIAEGAENAEIQKRLAAQGNAKVRHYHVTEPLAAADLLIYLLKTQQPSA